jgi:hypothetical protein
MSGLANCDVDWDGTHDVLSSARPAAASEMPKHVVHSSYVTS